jgi:hypothetical protein
MCLDSSGRIFEVAEVSPSDVRFRVVQEYEFLRRSIDELEASTASLLSDGESAVADVLARSAKLFDELSDYIDLEESFVLPSVRNADVWGAIRARALERKHADHRGVIGTISREVLPDPTELANDVRALTHALRESLEREKREILSAELLRDDIVGIDVD